MSGGSDLSSTPRTTECEKKGETTCEGKRDEGRPVSQARRTKGIDSEDRPIQKAHRPRR